MKYILDNDNNKKIKNEENELFKEKEDLKIKTINLEYKIKQYENMNERIIKFINEQKEYNINNVKEINSKNLDEVISKTIIKLLTNINSLKNELETEKTINSYCSNELLNLQNEIMINNAKQSFLTLDFENKNREMTQKSELLKKKFQKEKENILNNFENEKN